MPSAVVLSARLWRACGSLSCSVHTEIKTIYFKSIAHGTEHFLNRTEAIWHEDFDGFVAEVAVTLASEFDSIVCADLQSLFQS